MRRLIIVAAGLLLAACEGPPQDLQASGGEAIYAKLCASCHAPDGKSLATLAPPLAGHAVRMLQAGGRSHLIRIVLNGMAGPIEVKGRRYDAVMTPLRYLKDEQVADVLNFVLTSWGNDALLPVDHKPFTPEEIRKQREPVSSPKQMAAERPRLDATGAAQP
ncbi:MAG: cytochrome c [Vicinamibacteria bacterium]